MENQLALFMIGGWTINKALKQIKGLLWVMYGHYNRVKPMCIFALFIVVEVSILAAIQAPTISESNEHAAKPI